MTAVEIHEQEYSGSVMPPPTRGGERTSSERIVVVEEWCKSKDRIDEIRHQNNLEKLNSLVAKVEEVLVQTTKTNGRVSALESWRERVAGAWWMLCLLASICVTGGAFAGWLLARFFHP